MWTARLPRRDWKSSTLERSSTLSVMRLAPILNHQCAWWRAMQTTTPTRWTSQTNSPAQAPSSSTLLVLKSFVYALYMCDLVYLNAFGFRWSALEKLPSRCRTAWQHWRGSWRLDRHLRDFRKSTAKPVLTASTKALRFRANTSLFKLLVVSTSELYHFRINSLFWCGFNIISEFYPCCSCARHQLPWNRYHNDAVRRGPIQLHHQRRPHPRQLQRGVRASQWRTAARDDCRKPHVERSHSPHHQHPPLAPRNRSFIHFSRLSWSLRYSVLMLGCMFLGFI